MVFVQENRELYSIFQEGKKILKTPINPDLGTYLAFFPILAGQYIIYLQNLLMSRKFQENWLETCGWMIVRTIIEPEHLIEYMYKIYLKLLLLYGNREEKGIEQRQYHSFL